MSNKLFSEQEIQDIIKRAADLQKAEQAKTSDKEGLTIEEIIEAGTAAGLDVHHITTAAMEMRGDKVTRYSGISDTHIFEEREIKTPLNGEKAWNEIVSELRHHFGEDTFGKTNINSHRFEWSHTSLSGIETLASLTERDGSYRIRLSQRVGLASSLTEGVFYGSGLAFLASIGATALFLKTFVAGAIFFGVSVAPFSLLVYALDVAWRKKKLRRLKELTDKITDQIKTMFISSTGQERITIESQEQRQSNNDEAQSEQIKT